MAASTDRLSSNVTLEVFRYHPDDGQPGYQAYEVAYHDDWVVLDALVHLKDNVDGTLTFRWSCRMGTCGSCGMMVNGEPRLACETFLSEFLPGPIRVEPLEHFPVVRDLVINMDAFLERLPAAKTWLIPAGKPRLASGEYAQTPAEHARYQRFSMCINCLLCYAACPVSGMEEGFLGPAVIALAQRWSLDSRDGGRRERTEIIGTDDGIWGCTFVGDCTRVCPKGVDPAGAIQMAKISRTLDWYRSLLPFGRRTRASAVRAEDGPERAP